MINFFEELAKDSGLVCYGFNDVIFALINGVINKLVLFEDLKVYYEIIDDQIIQKKDGSDEELLIDHLIDIANDHGAIIEFVSDSTSEGQQFVIGFGGIGGFLRYKIEMPQTDDLDDEELDDDYFI